MKVTINTDDKTLELISEVSVDDLIKMVNECKLQNYKIIPNSVIIYKEKAKEKDIKSSLIQPFTPNPFYK